MTYPVAKTQPTAVTFGRVSYTDSYKWLEEETPEVLEWQSGQDRYTRDWLKSRPARARADALVAAVPRLEGDFPTFSGGRWFRTRTPPDQNLHVIEVANAIDGPWCRIVDLNTMTTGEPLSIDNFLPSPDGRKLLYGWGIGGRELAELRVIDVDSGKTLLDSIRQVHPFFPAWFADSSGFYYTAFEPGALSVAKVFRQPLGQEPVTRSENYEASHSMTWAKASVDGRHYFIVADHLNPRPEYICEGAAGGAWRPFLKGQTSLFRGDIIGNRYYAITNDGAKCGRVVSIPLATPTDRSTWKELVPGSANVLATLIVVDGHFVLLDLVDCYSRMRVFDAHGTLKGEVTLPGRGSVSMMQFAAFNMMDAIRRGGNGDVLFPFSSPVQAPALYRTNVHTLEVEALTQPVIKLDATIRDFTATSADGARVPYHVIARSDIDASRPQPAVMYGYGGFNVALVPGWPGAQLVAWVQAGGVLVLTHLRGGGELGPDMWHQGRLEHKQNSFNDVYAIAEDLIKRRITTAAQLGVVGGSNGGTMAAAVSVQRPDLFRAVISQVPVTDVLGRARDPITMGATLDYGDPNDAEMSEVLFAWSPYQHVKDGAVYPAVLLDAGKNDSRCPPWHVRKMAARMQPANGGPNPILMRVRESAGHGAVGKEDQYEFDADALTFFIDQLGLAPEKAER